MTQEEKGKTYALHKAGEKLHDYYGSAMLNVVQFDGHDIQCAYVDGYLQAKQDLEVKEVDLEECQKENIDLEKEVNQYFEKTWPFEEDDEDIIAFARHFFELGLKAQKGE